MNTQPTTEELHIILVNPAQELKNYYIDSFKQENCVFSCYSRPDRSDHPKLQPGRNPTFDIVVYDLQSYIGGLSSLEVMDRLILPDWFRDFVGRINRTFCVLLASQETHQAVSVALRHHPQLQGLLSNNRHIEVVIRDPDFWEDNEGNPAKAIRELWNNL